MRAWIRPRELLVRIYVAVTSHLFFAWLLLWAGERYQVSHWQRGRGDAVQRKISESAIVCVGKPFPVFDVHMVAACISPTNYTPSATHKDFGWLAGIIAASVCAPFLPPILHQHVLSDNVERVLFFVGCDWQVRT